MEFYKILQSIMDARHLTVAETARLTGLSDSTVRSILTRKQSRIALNVALKFSEGLSLSLSELNDGEMLEEGRVDLTPKEKPATPEGDGLDEGSKALVSLYNELPAEDRELLVQQAELLKKRRKQ